MPMLLSKTLISLFSYNYEKRCRSITNTRVYHCPYKGKFVAALQINVTDYTFGIYVVKAPISNDLLERDVAHKLNTISRDKRIPKKNVKPYCLSPAQRSQFQLLPKAEE